MSRRHRPERYDERDMGPPHPLLLPPAEAQRQREAALRRAMGDLELGVPIADLAPRFSSRVLVEEAWRRLPPETRRRLEQDVRRLPAGLPL